MLWWGRFGKVLQFAAGCAVLIDLVNPEKLREQGVQARNRSREMQIVRTNRQRLKRLEHIQDGIAGLVILGGLQNVDRNGRTVTPEQNLPELLHYIAEMEPRLTSSVLQEFRQHALHGLDQWLIYKDGVPKSLTPEYVDRIKESSRKLLEAMLTPENLTLLKLGDRAKESYQLSIAAGRLGCCGGPILAAVSTPILVGLWNANFLSEKAVSAVSASIWSLWLYCVLVLVITLVSMRFNLTISGAVAVILDKARPAHVFRWIAFFLFLVGSFLDILAT